MADELLWMRRAARRSAATTSQDSAASDITVWKGADK